MRLCCWSPLLTCSLTRGQVKHSTTVKKQVTCLRIFRNLCNHKRSFKTQSKMTTENIRLTESYVRYYVDTQIINHMKVTRQTSKPANLQITFNVNGSKDIVVIAFKLLLKTLVSAVAVNPTLLSAAGHFLLETR